MIHEERIRRLNDEPVADGTYVLYWMQQSQRARCNHALEYAIRRANELDQSVVVGFGLTPSYPEATLRAYAFMLEGLQEVADDLRKRRIKFLVRSGEPDAVALDLSERASLVVCDRGYLRHQRGWRERVAQEAGRSVVRVESDVVVPVEEASEKQEIGARTLRPKIQKKLDSYLSDLSETDPVKDGRYLDVHGDVDLKDLDSILERLDVDRSVGRVRRFRGGTGEARRLLESFLRQRLKGYDEDRNEPGDWHSSLLSPYLHFGQISPVEVALKTRRAASGTSGDRDAFVEELVVRRELAVNFVFYESDYDRYGCLPEWARKTMAEHRDDERAHVYTRSELEGAETHDEYWNAAMKEMVHTGFMQNYMRMYWGKKILEWTRTPEYAFRTTLALNNKYFLDGRDPNSFANVAWCFGLHDRGWTERPIFGKVRYMNDRGLERKFDMERYVKGVERLIGEEADD